MKEKLIILFILVIASLFRLYLIAAFSPPFPYDMGRDLLWTKDIAFYHIPTLIGPAASIWGVYFQPFWYYFLALPLFLSGGDPLSAVFATSTALVGTSVLAFILFKKYLPKLYLFTLFILLLFSQTLVNISTFAFHANLLPPLTLLATYFIFLSIVKNPIFLAAASFFVSLMFSADPQPAVVFTLILIFIFFYLGIYKSKNVKRTITLSLLAYFIPFLPQILFELRNGFIQTKSLLTYFLGGNPSLSGQLPILQRIPNRLEVYFDFVRSSFAGGSFLLAIILIALAAFGIYQFTKIKPNRNQQKLFKVNTLILILSFVINTIINVEIKNWYLYGITFNIALLIVFAIYSLRSNIVTFAFLTIFLLTNLLPFAKDNKISESKLDPASLANQLQVIDLLYSQAQKPFSVYTYTPSIYDLNYQYLFWWQGVKKGRGLPSEFAYLPNQPDYVRNKSKYSKGTKIEDTIYLVVEKASENEFYTSKNWLKNFENHHTIWEQEINGAIIVQKRTK